VEQFGMQPILATAEIKAEQGGTRLNKPAQGEIFSSQP
jgi:hypothetical protein